MVYVCPHGITWSSVGHSEQSNMRSSTRENGTMWRCSKREMGEAVAGVTHAVVQ
jgi:hypothetical protein